MNKKIRIEFYPEGDPFLGLRYAVFCDGPVIKRYGSLDAVLNEIEGQFTAPDAHKTVDLVEDWIHDKSGTERLVIERFSDGLFILTEGDKP